MADQNKTSETSPLQKQEIVEDDSVATSGHNTSTESSGKAALLNRVIHRTGSRTISTGSQDSMGSLKHRRKDFRRGSSFDLAHHDSQIIGQGPPLPESIDPSKVPWWTSKRFMLAIMCFFGFLCLYSQRVNLSIAIVSMVDHSAAYQPRENTSHVSNLSVIIYRNETKLELKCPESVSSKTSKGEFKWNKELQGLILGSFFWGYLMLQVAGGWLSERFGAKKVIAIGMFPVAILNILSPVCARASPYLFIVVRVIVGLGEGVMYPAAQALWARWSPPSERSRLIGLSYAGGQFGNALIFPIGGFLCHYGFDGGWPSVFYVIGSAGFIWCVVWCIFAHDSPEEHPGISDIERKYIEHSLGHKKEAYTKKHPTPWAKIFKSKAVWAIIIAHSCGNYGIYMLLTQIPTYMKEVLKFDIKANGVFSMLPYLCFWFCILLSGVIADFLIKRDILTTVRTRKMMTVIGMVAPGAFLIGTGYMECDQKMAAVAMLTIAVGLCGFHFSGHFINHSDIAPPFAGTLFGISNTAATIPGILAPYIVGAMTKGGTREEWLTTFYVAAAIYTFGALVFVVLAEGEVQPWGNLDEHGGLQHSKAEEPETISLKAIEEHPHEHKDYPETDDVVHNDKLMNGNGRV